LNLRDGYLEMSFIYLWNFPSQGNLHICLDISDLTHVVTHPQFFSSQSQLDSWWVRSLQVDNAKTCHLLASSHGTCLKSGCTKGRSCSYKRLCQQGANTTWTTIAGTCDPIHVKQKYIWLCNEPRMSLFSTEALNTY
jgi:hypothetical protein